MSKSAVPPSNDNPVGSFGVSPHLDNNSDSNSTASSTKEWTKVDKEEEHSDTAEQNVYAEDTNSAKSDDGQAVDSLSTYWQKQRNGAMTRKEFYTALSKVFTSLEISKESRRSTLSLPLRREEMAHYAGEYTSILRTYFQQFDEENDPTEFSLTRKELRIWSLCEIVYFKGCRSDVITSELSLWMNELWSIDEKRSREDTKDLDWRLIYSYILRGDTREASEILEAHIDDMEGVNYNILARVVPLLQSAPALPSSVFSKEEKAEWDRWHQDCVDLTNQFLQKNDEDVDSTEPVIEELSLVLKILAGDKQSIMQTGSTFERLLGFLLYQNPFCLRDGIIALCPPLDPDEEENTYDGDSTLICYYILLGEYEEAMSLMEAGWLAPHFGHLLISAGYSEDDDSYSSVDPIYYLIYSYAAYIAEEYGLWMEAVRYNYACKPHSEEWIEELLDPLDKKDVQLINNVLNFCIEHKLERLTKVIYYAMAQNYESQGEILAAVKHYALSGDDRSIEALDRIAQKTLTTYTETGILDNVLSVTEDTQAAYKSRRYCFLLQYYQMRNDIQNAHHKKVTPQIIQLLSSDATTEQFKVILLIDSFSVLDDYSQQNMDEMTTNTLLDHLLDISRKHQRSRDYFAQYYKLQNPQSNLTSDEIVAKLRERLVFYLVKASDPQAFENN